MKTTFAIIVSLMFALYCHAQQEATTKEGKKVTLNPDGTWKYDDAPAPGNSDFALSECGTKWISVETDKMEGKTSIAANEIIIVSTDGGKTGFGIFLMLSSKFDFIFSIQAVGASSCIDEGAKIIILFDDDTRMELANDADFNCKGDATVYFGGVFGKRNQLELLKTKKIKTMRVWTRDSYVEKDFSPTNQQHFFNVTNCLVSLMK